MQLSLNNVLPVYFDKSKTTHSEIWNRDLVFEQGDWVKIVAPSGSGKSSLISFLYGTRSDFNGTIQYDATAVKDLPAEQMAQLRRDDVSVVFQDLRLFPQQTLFANLEIKRQLNPYHTVGKITEMAAKLGIEDRLQTPAGICSYGEQQRAAIIRSLLQPFKILLLDEPFSHLDNANSEKAMDLMLEECRSRNATIIFADLERIDYFPSTRLYHL